MTDLSESYHTSEVEQKLPRDAEYVRYRELVYVELLRAGMDKDAEAYLHCSDPVNCFQPDLSGDLPLGTMGVNACSADHKHPAKTVCPTCHKRYCCDCAHQQSARLLARYTPFLKGLVRDSGDVYKLRHIVLTSPIRLIDPSCREEMHDLFNKIRDEFWDILIGKNWRDDCGVLIASDFGEDGHKLHFHMLVYSPWIDKESITDAWQQITSGLCEVNWIRLVTEDKDGGHTVDSAVAEILKYATKLWKKDKDGKVIYLDPTLVPVLAIVLKGTRRIRSYGLFNGFTVAEEPHVCEVCAAPRIYLHPEEWYVYCETGFLPFDYDKVRRGEDLLDLITGNNFFEGGGGKKPESVDEQLILPVFAALIDNKYINQFEMGG